MEELSPQQQNMNTPIFDGHSGKYNNNTFLGRFQNFRDVTDPRSMFVSDQDVKDSLDLLDRFKKGLVDPVSNNDALWKAKKVVDATIHPDTGDVIPLAFRMCSFLPINVVICAGLILPNPAIGTTIFWQWINQSYNIALNHANRNASNTMSTQQIFKSYVSAVGISCSLAVGLGYGVNRLKIPSVAVQNGLKMLVPFTAVTTAGVANVLIMRGNEMKDGIDVKDKFGQIHGKSQEAGKMAVYKVAFSRVATSFPALLLPPIVMSFVDKLKFVQKYPKVKLPINLAVIAAIFNSSLPAAIALFPQESTIETSKLEPRFHNLKDKDGNLIKEFIYNKGL
ncbi:sideroflexin [Heterostelium album PN500]|uniref:Sidoreflexin n=1 Tax=Heterostelium pallidum (strain ATCC 26659 / Pp 5 / PN500) TaxID=670386 RepID=D3BJ85_HETP5|nr:sideroflexin [Heterostelium album PN500]EFA77965.1 sideroflexin [Heterostelium album PN500]|eukprot:XP_020430093.1 sideroflexin [Heterostelium album PN500]